MNQHSSIRPRVRHSALACRIAAILLAAGCLPALAQQGFDQAPTNYPPPQPMQQQQMPQQPMQQQPYQQPPMQMPPTAAGYPPGTNGQAPYPGQQPNNPGQSGFGQSGGDAAGNPLAALVRQEMQDFGVQPMAQLQTNMHGPTPTSIPGGQVITTDRLLSLYQQGQQNGLLVFHVLGQGPTLPNAQNAAPASQAGSFNDQTQQGFSQYLQQVTQGNTGRPLVFYCLNTQCWMSYNAALRAINMGYSQVYWYRGGVEAWNQAQQLSQGMAAQSPMPDVNAMQQTGNPY